jgi:hypothetical protein
VRQLHNAGRHEHVIAAIQGALANGQAQPWMYDVLALSLEIAGHPKEEVERAVFSGVDFAGADFENMMVSAAYLARFERPQAALHLYRQASKVAPTRPEPYVMALRLARDARDEEAIRGAARGVLTYAWTDDFAQLHKQAEAALLDSADRLRRDDRAAEADLARTTLQEALQRDLIVKLTWNGNGDLDLLVEEPSGSVCSFDMPQTEGGGVLVHDGYGPDQANCYEEYVCALGLPGTYKLRVRHAWGQIVGKRALLTVVRYQGTPAESVRTFTVELEEEDAVIRLSLENGRRDELAEVPAESTPRAARRRSLLQMVGHVDRESRNAARRFAGSRQPEVGFQPVISVISEGVSLGALATVSGDRRYVRLSLSPTFSNITDVFTFSFSGPGAGTTGRSPLGAQGGNPGAGLPGGFGAGIGGGGAGGGGLGVGIP